MKTIFLTSSVGGYKKTEKGKVAINIDNSNHFVDELKKIKPKWKNFVVVCSDPDGYQKTDEYASIYFKAFNLDGFGIENMTVLDHRFKGDVEKAIMEADVVFLSGGYTPKQNAYLKEIHLDKILKDYDGIVIGQSAGSMNLAETVYCPPDILEDLSDDYKRSFSGVGLTNIRIMPHMNIAKCDNIGNSGKNTYDFLIEDSFKFPVYGIFDYGFIEIKDGKAISFGKTLLFKDGKEIELCKENEKVEVFEDYSRFDDTKIEK